MNDEKKPAKPQAAKPTPLAFVDMAMSPSMSVDPTVEVTLPTLSCCVEALAYAVRAALAAGLVDPRQAGCLSGVFAHLIGKLPAPLVKLMGMAIKRADEKHKARTAKALYDAATASPSCN